MRTKWRELHGVRPPDGRGRTGFLRSVILAVLGLVMAGVSPLPAASRHELIVCGSLNKDFVIGSKLTTVSGLYRRGENESLHHFGFNHPLIWAISVDPRNHDEFYLGTLNGCVKTLDGGKTWRILTSWDMTEPHDVCVDPNAPDTVYLALPDGVAVSTDRGATWPRREKGLPARGKYTQVIKVDRTKAGRVLAGCETGIYLTENAAASWKRVFATETTVLDVQQSPHDPKVWLAVSQNNGALISRDGGRSWTQFKNVPSEKALYNIAFDATNPQRYAIGSWTYGVLTTEDGGNTWIERNAGLPDGHCVYRVGIDPDTGRLYANIYRVSLHYSDDFGRTWQLQGADGLQVHSFNFIPKAAK